MSVDCNICGLETDISFKAKVLYKYDVGYFKCPHCGFIQTEKPFWLAEAYKSPINTSDLGLIKRNIDFSNVVPGILDLCSTVVDSYIDYGGGYGMFVRIMRDKGYNFYLQEMYTENLFAKNFEFKDYKKAGKFKALTAFEVFEHLADPIEEIKKMLNFSDILIFSTELQPNYPLQRAGDWWYLGADTGQHVSFYTLKSLNVLAKKLNLFVYSNGSSLHILSKVVFKQNPFETKEISSSTIKRLISKLLSKNENARTAVLRSSLLQSDFEFIKKKEQYSNHISPEK